MCKNLYRQVEGLVETMDPVRFDDILTDVLIREISKKADTSGQEEAGLNGLRSQLFNGFYKKYDDWKWSMFQNHNKTKEISFRKKAVISTINKMDKSDGKSVVFNRFVWIALGRELVRAVDEDKHITKAEEANNVGTELVKARRYEESLNYFDEAIRQSRQFCLPQVNKGIALGNLERFREAADCFRLAVATDPNFKIAWFNMALVFKKTGDFNYAQRAVSKALEIDPEYEAAGRLKEEILLKSKVLDGRRN